VKRKFDNPRALPFSCPFDATKTGKRQQKAASSETAKQTDFLRVGARDSNSQQGPATRG
jgi:hypothetical protein